MNDKYKKMLDSLKEDSTPRHVNDRILLIDGLNTFIRSFAVNPSTNEDGIHIGGMTGFLHSIGYAIRNIKPTRVIICFDGKGGSQRRRKLFPGYKDNRRVRKHLTRANTFSNIEDERISMGQQIRRLTEYLACLPVTVLATENIEADDAMAYICQQVYPKSQCILMSTDKDFLQLVDDRVQVWSPTKKKFYCGDTIKEEFGIESKNFIILKCITGDGSDNIPGIKGAGLKSLEKRLPILFDKKELKISDVVDYVQTNGDKTKLSEALSQSTDLLELNYKLMQLKDVNISGYAKESILNIVKSDPTRLNKLKFESFVLEDNINSIFKNPGLWLKDSFSQLDKLAESGEH
tara:strand:- start:173 stop:1216 length:1044 start_codon:yes stop_codon:yes gene_type:complete